MKMEKTSSKDNFIEFNARLVPKSSRNEISEVERYVYKIKITSPPVDGKANRALIELLSKTLKKPKKNIEIISGLKSRNKRIRIYDITESEFYGKIRH